MEWLVKVVPFIYFCIVNYKSIVFMKHSYFCQDCEILHSRGFFFDTCTILVRLLRVDSSHRTRYLLEITRYIAFNMGFPTNVRVDDITNSYRDALTSYLFTVSRYQHFYDLEFNRRLYCSLYVL